MRIVLVEDHVMFRDVLRKVCVEDLQHEVVAEAGDGPTAVRVVGETKPDLVLLDLHLPNLDGFGVLDEIRKARKGVRVLILSSHCDEYTVFHAQRARVQGFVDKNTNSVATLKLAIREIEQGRVWFSPAFQQVKAARLDDTRSFDKLLTKRERVILSLVGEALSDVEISQRLHIAWETVEKHRFNIQRKLAVESRADLIRYAKEHGFTLIARRPGDGALLP